MTNRHISRTLLRLFFVSLIVGLALSALNVSPEAMLGAIGGTAESIFEPSSERWSGRSRSF